MSSVSDLKSQINKLIDSSNITNEDKIRHLNDIKDKVWDDIIGKLKRKSMFAPLALSLFGKHLKKKCFESDVPANETIDDKIIRLRDKIFAFLDQYPTPD